MKPTISVDERGVLLHMVDDDGHGYAVALNEQTLTELGGQITAALEKLQAPERRGQVLWRIGRAIVRELMRKDDDGSPPSADRARAENR